MRARPPYLLLVGTPVSETGVRDLSRTLAGLAAAVENATEAARYRAPVPHIALVVTGVEGTRLTDLRERASSVAENGDVVLVESPHGVSPSRLSAHYDISRRALEVVVNHYRPDAGIVPLAGVSLDRMLLSVPHETQFRFLRETCGTILLQRVDVAMGYLDTIAAILESGGQASAPAKALHLHRQGVVYRRRRITELGGRDPAAPEYRPVFLAALRLLHLAGASFPPIGNERWQPG